METTVKDIRSYCLGLKKNRIEELEKILSEYFKEHFIEQHLDWPERVDIDDELIFPYAKKGSQSMLSKNNMRREFVYTVLEDSLGFIVLEGLNGLLVPDCEEGKELTFAKKWRKKVKDSYECYMADLAAKKEEARKCAREIYLEFLSKLSSYVSENDIIDIISDIGCTYFRKFTFKCKFPSREVQEEFRQLMLEGGIKSWRWDGERFADIVIRDSMVDC